MMDFCCIFFCRIYLNKSIILSSHTQFKTFFLVYKYIGCTNFKLKLRRQLLVKRLKQFNEVLPKCFDWFKSLQKCTWQTRFAALWSWHPDKIEQAFTPRREDPKCITFFLSFRSCKKKLGSTSKVDLYTSIWLKKIIVTRVIETGMIEQMSKAARIFLVLS